MRIESKIGMSGEFGAIEVLGNNGEVKRSLNGPKNLITNIGLDRIKGGIASVYGYCRAGAGNAEPQFSDMQLQNQLGSASPTQASATTGVNVEDRYIWIRLVWTFSLGAVVGNVSELATGWAASGDTIFSRALVKDIAGNPTSITVLEDEQLRVTWEHRRYWQAEPNTGIILNEGNKGGSYSWTISPAIVLDWQMGHGAQIANSGRIEGFQPIGVTGSDMLSGVTDIGPVDSSLIGGVRASPLGSMVNLETGPRSIGIRFVADVSQALNPGGINGFVFKTRRNSGGAGTACGVDFKATIDPPIYKTNEDFLEIEFVLSWDRV